MTHISVWILKVSWKLGNPSPKAGACGKKMVQGLAFGKLPVGNPEAQNRQCATQPAFFRRSNLPQLQIGRSTVATSLEQGAEPVWNGTFSGHRTSSIKSGGLNGGENRPGNFLVDLSWEITLLLSRKNNKQYHNILWSALRSPQVTHDSSITKDYVPIRPSAMCEWLMAGQVPLWHNDASKRKWDHSVRSRSSTNISWNICLAAFRQPWSANFHQKQTKTEFPAATHTRTTRTHVALWPVPMHALWYLREMGRRGTQCETSRTLALHTRLCSHTT